MVPRGKDSRKPLKPDNSEAALSRFRRSTRPWPNRAANQHAIFPATPANFETQLIDPCAALDESRSEPAPNPPASGDVIESTCPACGHHVAVDFFAGGDQPLTTLAWPKSKEQAHAMPRLPHQFVRCVDCGHIYNAKFEYSNVPYSDKPNLMYNRGAIWSKHIDSVKQLILKQLAAEATVIEIGCGDGSLLSSLAAAYPKGRFVGFDPNSTIENQNGKIEVRAELFNPSAHLAELKPDIIISRHVLEHLLNPLGFIQQLAFAVSWHNIDTTLLIEVPCVDGALNSGRTADFFYEHNSHFTTQSLERMLARCASDVRLAQTAYNGEVAFALADFRPRREQVEHARQSLAFRARAVDAGRRLAREFDTLADSPGRVAIWGGTGKAAAFINQNQLDAQRFPLVVDSDASKVGTHVPGAGQAIECPSVLLYRNVETIVIATQWRASDIALEITRRNIPFRRILLEFEGRLIDFHRDPHPYEFESAGEQPAGHGPNSRPPVPHARIRDLSSRLASVANND